jgi:hypothetical protein
VHLISHTLIYSFWILFSTSQLNTLLRFFLPICNNVEPCILLTGSRASCTAKSKQPLEFFFRGCAG